MLLTVAQAAVRRRPLAITYRDKKDRPTERVLQPYGVVAHRDGGTPPDSTRAAARCAPSAWTGLGPDGSVEDRAPRIAHPGGDWGYPVFTEFGADLPELLRRAGFEVDVLFGPTRDDDLAQVYVCRKPV